jgi:GT2 family glycosyltransferase/thioesterase domain-containing protein
VIAFEIARRLTREGEQVGLLALIDSVAPQARAVPLRIARARMRRFARLVAELRSRGVLAVARETQRRACNIARHELFAQREKARAHALVWLLERRYAQTQRDWPKRLPAPSVRDVYMRALGDYTGEPIDDIPSVLFRATEGAGDDMPVRELFEDPCFGWRELLGGSVRVIDSPGGHSTMLQQGRVDAIASHLRAAFDAASAREAEARSAVAGHARPTRVTILVVSYRTAALVARLLASIAAERERTRDTLDIRTLVVDNASGDAPALREALDAGRWHDWATLLEAERNGGFAYGNNLGFAHAYARGEAPDFFYLLNPDTEVRPGAIAALVEFLQAHPGAGIAGSSLETASGEPWPYAFRFPSLQSEIEQGLGFSLATRLLSRKVVARRMGARAEPIDWIPGAAMMVRRRVIDHVGGMDERYFLYYEETDFCRKVKAAGYSVWYVPQSRVMHIAGQSTGVTVQRETARRLPDYWFESRRRYFAKHHGVGYAMATDALTLIASALGRVKLALQRRSARAVPRYLFDVARHSPLRAKNRTVLPAQEFRAAG